MPQYFFHLRSTATTQRDELGSEFSDLDAAYLATCQAITGMALDLSNACGAPKPYVFDIPDAAGRVLMQVPFGEMLNRGQKPERPAQPSLRWESLPGGGRGQRLGGGVDAG